jgi:hypothetical protein
MSHDAISTRAQTFWRAVSVSAVAAALTWVAAFNGDPLSFPDEIGYVRQSAGILDKLRGRDVPYWRFDLKRSEIYSASLHFLHHGPNLWPIVWLQAFFTAWVLWLVVRALFMQRPLPTYLAICAVLVPCSGVAWYVACVMPDILGPLLYLAFFLLVVLPHTLRPWEKAALWALSAYAVTSHASHLLVVGALLAAFTAFWAAKWTPLLGRGRQLALFAGLLVACMLAQMAVHRRLFHQATLFGDPPAFLMARLLGDGPARTYLQSHCTASPWLICRYAGHLPTSDEEFLWEPGGVSMNATPDQQAQLRKEQYPLLFATLRTYPRQQITRSLRNFGAMMVRVGPVEYHDYGFPASYLEYSLPGSSARYARTKQARNALPQRFWEIEHTIALALSLALVLALLPAAFRARRYALLALATVVLITLPVNAFLNGVLVGVYPRYQGRLAWLLMLLAGVMLYDAWQRRQAKLSPAA